MDDSTAEQERKQVVGEVAIRNPQGMHARPVMRFVDVATTFSADITVEKTNEPSDRVNGKSPMEMMVLCAPHGTALRIIAEGDDAEEAIQALVALVDRYFDQPIQG